MSILTNKYVLLICRWLLAVVFIWAALDKIVHPEQFARIIYNYRILPGELVNLMAIILPWLEVITAFLLIVGYWEKAAALLVGGMLAMFIGALAFSLTRGIDIECGCFSTTSHARHSIISLLIRDILMLIPVFLIIRGRESALSLDHRSAATT
jgi:uncharacterized membrane protein YphA (DoxX/SURF4 family)